MEDIFIKTKLEDGTYTIHIGGRFDAVGALRFEKEVISDIESSSYSDIVISFKDLNYISSAGFSCLLKMQKLANMKASKLCITDVSESIMELIKMTGFDNIITIKET